MQLTERDREILETLSRRVRVLSVAQVAHGWWGKSRKPIPLASRRLRALARAGWLIRQRVIVRPLPPLQGPELRWRVGDDTPDFDEAAYRLASRWRLPARATGVVFAGRAARQTHGAGGGPLRCPTQTTHDLGVSQMYLTLRQLRTSDAQEWVGEDQLPRPSRGEKLPDAVLRSEGNAKPHLLLEFGGAYDARRLRSLHRFAKRRRFPYEVW